MAWLREAGWLPSSIEPLSGDVSPRRYFRVLSTAGAAAILATYPREIRETCRRFAQVSELLDDCGVPIPRIYAVDVAAGRMLLEDLGPETLYDRRALGWTYLAPRLEGAAELIALIQEIPSDRIVEINPALDITLLTSELLNTWRLALATARLAEYGLPAALETALEAMLERLGDSPQTPCHRDFMARNLVPDDDAGPDNRSALRVLDFQDLRLGPRAYDLASLLNDSLFAPPELEESLLGRWLASPEDRLAYHRCAAQRGLKIAGTYLGFAERGSARHLPLVEPSLGQARRHLLRLPELQPARAAIDQLINALLSTPALAGPLRGNLLD